MIFYYVMAMQKTLDVYSRSFDFEQTVLVFLNHKIKQHQ